MFKTFKTLQIISRALLLRDSKVRRFVGPLSYILGVFNLFFYVFGKIRNWRIKRKYFNRKLIEKYRDSVLGIRHYGPRQNSELFTKDVIDFDKLSYILAEINELETSLTELGHQFLGEYYGLKNLAEELYRAGWYSENFQSPQEILSWLEGIKTDKG